MRSSFGYIILWLMGVPISTLILIWIVSSLVGR
jgi:hypothetical protein